MPLSGRVAIPGVGSYTQCSYTVTHGITPGTVLLTVPAIIGPSRDTTGMPGCKVACRQGRFRRLRYNEAGGSTWRAVRCPCLSTPTAWRHGGFPLLSPDRELFLPPAALFMSASCEVQPSLIEPFSL